MSARIDDGYGDAPVLTEEEFLATYDRWVKATAFRVCYPSRLDRVADVEQEGRIALWRAYRSLDGHPEQIAYSMTKAKHRMAEYAADRRPPTGHTRGAGGEHADVATLAVLDAPVFRDSVDTLMTMLAAVDWLGEIEVAYHHGEIMQVINGLDPAHREYIYRRFWEGWNDSEIARHLGVSTSGMHNRWTRTIRPALVARLGHLVAA